MGSVHFPGSCASVPWWVLGSDKIFDAVPFGDGVVLAVLAFANAAG
jgi:hypothetical protein